MKRSLRPTLGAGLSLAIAILIADAAMTSRQLWTLAVTNRGVIRSRDVLGELGLLSVLLGEAEGWQRTYCATGAESSLVTMRDRLDRLDRCLQHLGDLTAAKPLQQARIVDLRREVGERVKLLEKEGELRRRNGPNYTPGDEREYDARRAMTRVRGLLIETWRGESRGLDGWYQASQAALGRIILLGGMASGVAVLLLGCTAYFARQNIALGRKAEEEHARLLAEAESANRAKDQFLAVLSHELRTPLTPVLMTVSASLEDGVDPSIRPMLEMILRNVELESRLIDDLLDISRIARGDLRLDLDVVDVHGAIRRAVEMCQAEILTSRLRVAWDLDAHQFHVRADEARLMQVFWNLTKNAAKFTPGGGLLMIRSRNEGDPAQDASGRRSIVVEFQDTGVGIEPGLLSRIFDPFEQGPPEQKRRFGGLGLGLAISRSVVESHGGRLLASSPGPGQGAIFRVDLTTVPAPSDIPMKLPLPPTGGVRVPQNVEILLVEDNPDSLRYIALVLRQRGYGVRTAETVASARTLLSEWDFDLIISDVELPDGSGLELMRDVAGRIPGIAISGFGSQDDIEISHDAGFAAHLAKPIVLRDLEDLIERTVRRLTNPA